MSIRIPLPLLNYSGDTRRASLGVAAFVSALALSALIAMVVLIVQSTSYWADRDRMLQQTSQISTELAALRKRDVNEPEASAIGALRQRIASLNSLDFGTSPAVARVLTVLEDLMPYQVALQNIDYDRSKGTIELVAVSKSSNELTTFYDIANRSQFFQNVRLVDKKQAGRSDDGAQLFQVRLSIHLSSREPKA